MLIGNILDVDFFFSRNAPCPSWYLISVFSNNFPFFSPMPSSNSIFFCCYARTVCPYPPFSTPQTYYALSWPPFVWSFFPDSFKLFFLLLTSEFQVQVGSYPSPFFPRHPPPPPTPFNFWPFGLPPSCFLVFLPRRTVFLIPLAGRFFKNPCPPTFPSPLKSSRRIFTFLPSNLHGIIWMAKLYLLAEYLPPFLIDPIVTRTVLIVPFSFNK